MELTTRQELKRKLVETDNLLTEIGQKYEAALLDNDTYLALAFATEGVKLAALGYAYTQRLRDSVETADACPDVIKAVEDMLSDKRD